jgi:membrane protein implicated in regulation of membrane protease activity
VAAALVSLAVAVWVQVLVFVGGAPRLLALLRPIARRAACARPPHRHGCAPGRALSCSSVDVNGGRVKIGGEEWSARVHADQAFNRALSARRQDRGRSARHGKELPNGAFDHRLAVAFS